MTAEGRYRVYLRVNLAYSVEASGPAEALNLAKVRAAVLEDGVSLYELGADAHDQRLYLHEDGFVFDDIIEDDD